MNNKDILCDTFGGGWLDYGEGKWVNWLEKKP